jgi:membrane protein DedA with SNARE-associated domain
MQKILVDIMNQYGYFGIVLLIAVENIFPPIPSEVILTFGGAMTTYTEMEVWGVIFWATVGSLIGAIVLYAVGRIFSEEKLKKIVSGKIGKILHFKREDVEKSMIWFRKRGNITVFFCRCIPIVRSLISIPAGMTGMDLGEFLILTISGTLIWNMVLVHLGAIAGASWEKIVGYINTYSEITKVILAAIAVLLVWKVIRKKKKGSDSI